MRYNQDETAGSKAILMVNPAIKPMTAEDYFARPETMLPEQLLDGELIVSPAPTSEHQYALANLHLILHSLIPNGRICLSPADVIWDEHNITQPDVFWMAENGRCVNKNHRFYGPPELIVEILSPRTARYDRTRKFDLYEKYGVTEYWIVDVDVRTIEVWTLQSGVYERVGHFLSGAAFESPVLGQRVETAPIFPPVE